MDNNITITKEDIRSKLETILQGIMHLESEIDRMEKQIEKGGMHEHAITSFGI